LNATTLAPTLERLQQFWLERRQEDGIGGDLGVASGGNGGEGSYFPPPPSNSDPIASSSYFNNNGGETNSNSNPATPAFTPGVAGGPSTIRRLRGEIRAARAEEKRFGKNRAMENGPAWWLDVMCPTVADMRELRKVSELLDSFPLSRSFSLTFPPTAIVHPITPAYDRRYSPSRN
jgi:hypothetical protein